MDKERSVKTDGGYSEKEMDSAMDKISNLNQVKAGSIFDSKKKKSRENIILDLKSQ